MENREFKKLLQECLSKYGFEYVNKKYYCTLDDVIIYIGVQKSNFSNSYYVDYSFSLKDYHENVKYPTYYERDFYARFSYEKPGESYPLSENDPTKFIASFENNIELYILPVINGGIKQYFHLYPKYLNLASKNVNLYFEKEK